MRYKHCRGVSLTGQMDVAASVCHPFFVLEVEVQLAFLQKVL